MRRFIAIVIAGLLAAALYGCCHREPGFIKVQPQAKKYDLVLLHGLTNKHRWSQAFLDVLLTIWGSGRVYLVYTNHPEHIHQRTIAGRRLTCAGDDDFSAGDDSIEVQAKRLAAAVERLQKDYGLGRPFNIIAHSMGGLVARRFIYLRPGAVAGLVTLGTPHQGSPLADSFTWAGYFIGATDAIADLRPKRVHRFNLRYPVQGAPLAAGGKVYTVRGGCPGGYCFGWGGELVAGWSILKSFYHAENDGMVPWGSAVITGAVHIADYPHHDHYQLVRDPRVALEVSRYLP